MRKKIQNGVAMIEFTFSLVIFFVLLFAIIEFGRTMLLWNMAADVTHRAARIVSVCDGRDPTNTDFEVWLKEGMVGMMTFTGQAMYYDGISSDAQYLGNTSGWLKYQYFPEGCSPNKCEYVKVGFSGIKINLNLFILNYEVDLPENTVTVARESMTSPGTCPFKI